MTVGMSTGRERECKLAWISDMLIRISRIHMPHEHGPAGSAVQISLECLAHLELEAAETA